MVVFDKRQINIFLSILLKDAKRAVNIVYIWCVERFGTFAQFKKREKKHGGVLLLVKWQA